MTLDSPAQLLDRFHDVLVSEIRERRPEYLSDAFTVAEIYQHLVPYASHRDRIGVEMNGDYEDILLRLLAGQGDFLELESKPARERLRQELESPNPDTSLFREYAAASVRLNPERVDTTDPEASPGGDEEDAPEPAPEATAREPESASEATAREPEGAPDDDEQVPEPVSAVSAPSPDGEPDAEDVASPVEGHAEPSPDPPAETADAPAPATEPAESERPPAAEVLEDGACPWCREELPTREKLNFCPFCGADVRLVPCADCGEALEPRWRFCIVCGQEAPGG